MDVQNPKLLFRYFFITAKPWPSCGPPNLLHYNEHAHWGLILCQHVFFLELTSNTNKTVIEILAIISATRWNINWDNWKIKLWINTLNHFITYFAYFNNKSINSSTKKLPTTNILSFLTWNELYCTSLPLITTKSLI